MAELLRGFLGGIHTSLSPTSTGDSDFAEFSEIPRSTPASTPLAGTTILPNVSPVPYTKWYNLHERHSLSDFLQEAIILCFLSLIIVTHLFGTRANRKKAERVASAFGPILRKEFSLLGFGSAPTQNDEWSGKMAKDIVKEKSQSEFIIYATGRQNVAFIDINVNLLKRYSPLSLIAETAMSMFFESITTPIDSIEAIIYPFDGKEVLLVPSHQGSMNDYSKQAKSNYNAFVWAVVHKDNIKQLRDDRYDISLTITKDSKELPNWTTVMSESSEITEILLTPELIRAFEKAGDIFRYLVITDQPIEQPVKVEDAAPKKRIYLSLKIPSSDDYTCVLPLFEYFLSLVDKLVQQAQFRPEVLRKVKTTREDVLRKLKLSQEEEKAEQRNLEREKAKKLKRDNELKALDSKAQKKYLEKEKEKEIRKNQKRSIQRR